MYFTIAEDIGSEFSVVVGCRLPDDFISEEEGNEEEKGVEKLSYLRRRRGVEKKVVLENKTK